MIIHKYIDKLTRLEKNKYMRERLFYQRENKIVMYEEANRKYHSCEDEQKDNLTKTAKTICKPNEELFHKFLAVNNLDYEDASVTGDIKLRIS